jgi:hypothetical protein
MQGEDAMLSAALPSYVSRLQWLELQSALALGAAFAFTASVLWFCRWRLQAPEPGASGLHHDRRASASLEFLLVFFPLLVLVLAVWQLAFMLNAQMHVGYAAYAAARSASTVAYIDTQDEPEGVLLNSGEPGAEKWKRINRAAIPGTLAISPGSAGAAGEAYLNAVQEGAIFDQETPNFDALDLGALPGQIALLTAHRGDEILDPGRIGRAAVKALYAERATRVLINGRDQAGRLRNGGRATDAYDVSDAGTLEVTVEYAFWLNVPYAGRMMRLAFGGNQAIGDVTQPTLTLRETVAINPWPQLTAY